MKMKLTYIQFMALYGILKTIAVSVMPSDIEARRDHVIILCIYQKFYAKAWEKKKKYSISLKPHEAMTWFIYFSVHNLDNATLEGNVLNTINNIIHQKFAV